MSGLWLNLGVGPWATPDPWIDLDVIENDEIHPDQLVDSDAPLASFADGSAARLLASHVLEHVPFQQVPPLLAEIRRVLEPGGELLALGPDVFRAIRRWHDGLEPWSIVEATLEDSTHYQQTAEEWPGASHKWNCRVERMLGLIEAAGFSAVDELPMTDEQAFAGWPIVSFAPWQCAVRATR